jgi:hypothetical protein
LCARTRTHAALCRMLTLAKTISLAIDVEMPVSDAEWSRNSGFVLFTRSRS